MKQILIVSLIACWLAVLPSLSQRCRRGIRRCGMISYDDCTGICCGNTVTPRNVNLACCGDERFGDVYNTETQLCCFWRNSAGIYDRSNLTNGAICCGTNVFDPSVNPNTACCGNWQNDPVPFNYLTEMCCDGVVGFAGNTAFTSCCGNSTYDRRVASCLCQDDRIYLIPEEHALCCRSIDGTVTNAYDRRTQSCCNGVPYDHDDQFCCAGRSVGSSDSEICCNGFVVPINANETISRFACCFVRGRYVSYNTQRSVCCGNTVQPRDPTINQICCGSTLYDPSINGTACCGSLPYFPNEQVCCNGVIQQGDLCCGGVGVESRNRVCCNGVVYDGDSCCNGIGYFRNSNFVCCQGVLQNTTAFIPACCVNRTFDAYIQTCCGATVYDNPEFMGPNGLEVSHATRCCGFFDNPSSLRPYDYFRQTCCDGVVVDLGDIMQDLAVCCGTSVIDVSEQLCCNDNIASNPYGPIGECCDDVVINPLTTLCCSGVPRNRSDDICCGDTFARIGQELCCEDMPVRLGGIPAANARCCGSDPFDTSQDICCRGTIQERLNVPNQMCCGTEPFDTSQDICCGGTIQQRLNVPNEVCCGRTPMDPSTDKCCEGIPRSLNGIAPDVAICCGDGCINGDLYWCCEGRQYAVGSIGGEEVEGLSCSDLFITE